MKCNPLFFCFVLTVALAARGVAQQIEDGLIGHWKLETDTRDYSDLGHHGHGTGLSFGEADSEEGRIEAAEFDGKTSVVEVLPENRLSVASQDFTISLWAHTEELLDDVLGDLVSKFDRTSRRGFNFSIQNNAGVTSSQSNFRHVHFGIDNAQSESQWRDHGRLGNAIMVFGLAVYQGKLFAGTCVADGGAGHVFRFDGETWTDCGSPDRCNSVSSLVVHDGNLYVGVSKYRLTGSSLPESRNPHLEGLYIDMTETTTGPTAVN